MANFNSNIVNLAIFLPRWYHKVVNSAIMDAIVRPFGGEHTPRSCLLTSVARVLHS